jgi:hypothetical protein
MCGVAGGVRCEGAIGEWIGAALGALGQLLDQMSRPC